MAITYHAGRRIQGLERVGSTLTDVDSPWTFANGDGSVSSGAVSFDYNQSTTDRGYHDLGANASGTWVFRFRLNITNKGNPSASNYLCKFGLGDNTNATSTSQGGIFFTLNHGSSYTNFNGFSSYNQLKQAGNWGSNSPSTYGYSTSTNYYVEVARTGTTTATVKVFTNANYTDNLVFTCTLSSVNASLNVRYVKITTDSYGDQGSNRYNGTMDQMKFYDGVTSVVAIAGDVKPTNVQVGSRLEETDTRKIYYYSYDWFELGTTIPFNATRGVFGGGSATNVMDYITIATTGNATDFGDLSAVNNNNASVSSDTRGVFCGGEIISSLSNVMEYITISTTGNTTDFGDLTVARRGVSGVSSDTRGVIAGGHSGSYSNVMDYITIASIGNATDFGDLSFGMFGAGGVSSDTRGVYGGGDQSGTLVNVIQYITIASTGNSTDFGDLTVIREGAAGVSSGTRGVFGGGNTGSVSNVIDYITIATARNATDFGDLTVARRNPAGVSSATRGVFGGGSTGSHSDIIDYITIATIGNATDFGDLTVARSFAAGVQGT